MAQTVGPVTIIEKSVAALIARMAADLEAKIQSDLKKQERFTFALSGGHTPRLLFETLARAPYRSTIPWSRLWIFWGDERTVPPEDPESNFGMAQKALLQHVPIPSAQIFRLKGELDPREAAREYQEQLQSVFETKDAPRLDLILLGLGPDGHTASLFPGTDALQIKHRWVTENEVLQLKTMRLTFTLPTLNQASAVWFLATGAEKAAAYARVRQGPNATYPASLVMPSAGAVTWYIDEAISHTA